MRHKLRFIVSPILVIAMPLKALGSPTGPLDGPKSHKDAQELDPIFGIDRNIVYTPPQHWDMPWPEHDFPMPHQTLDNPLPISTLYGNTLASDFSEPSTLAHQDHASASSIRGQLEQGSSLSSKSQSDTSQSQDNLRQDFTDSDFGKDNKRKRKSVWKSEQNENNRRKIESLVRFRFEDANLARHFLVQLGLEETPIDPFKDITLTPKQMEEVHEHVDRLRNMQGTKTLDGRFLPARPNRSRARLYQERNRYLQLADKINEHTTPEERMEIEKLGTELYEERRHWVNKRRRIAERVLLEEKRSQSALLLANALLERAQMELQLHPHLMPSIDVLKILLQSLPGSDTPIDL